MTKADGTNMKDKPSESNDNYLIPTQSSFMKNIALGISGIAAGSFLASMPFILMQLKSSLPYMATPRRKIVLALKEVEHRMMLKQNRSPNTGASNQRQLIFTDLGSGDGEAILAAVERGWVATGIEMNPTLWAVSMIRKICHLSREERSRATFRCGDFFNQNVSLSDAIMIFGIKPLMPSITQKIRSEAKSGAYILSYRFKLPFDQTDADLLLDQEDMRVYQLK